MWTTNNTLFDFDCDIVYHMKKPDVKYQIINLLDGIVLE